jgi:glycosyltransferase involved in cell wall biosynthesis
MAPTRAGKGPPRRLARRTYFRTIGRVRTIACVSEATRWEVFRSGVQGERLRVIHNGVDTELFRPADPAARAAARAKFALPPEAILLGAPATSNRG